MTKYCWAARMRNEYATCDDTCAAYKNYDCVFLTNLDVDKLAEKALVARLM